MHRSVINNIVIDCEDLEKGVAFWSAALGAKVVDREETYIFFEPIAGWLEIGIQKVPEAKQCKSRLHLDIRSDDVEAETRRLEQLGARRIEKIESWWVMQDPCGNEFCVIGGPQSKLPDHANSWEN